MSQAFETNVTCISLRNSSTTTQPAYTFVRMSTTTDTDFDIVGVTQTNWCIGITQAAINPGAVGPIGVSGISRLKMNSTALAAILRTTVIGIGSAANGRGWRMTTSLHKFRAVAIHAYAASDIATVLLREPSRFGY